ncbi:MAG: hypothetical protein GQ582_03675 [Methyloprofundus sp.]|nr:hypothetical protein [Methyloprofundus sp.]
MDLNKLEQQINTLTQSLAQEAKHSEFIYELLQAYDFPKSSITRLKKGDYNQAKNTADILSQKAL